LPFAESQGTAAAQSGHNGEKDMAPRVAQRAVAPQVRADLSSVENRVWLALELEPRHIDDIATAAQMSAAEVNATLLMLELKGITRRLPGSQFVRNE
jgi:DNA processing protein